MIMKIVIPVLLLMLAMPALAANRYVTWDDPTARVPDAQGNVEPFDPLTEIGHYLIYVDGVEHRTEAGSPTATITVGGGEHTVEVVVVDIWGARSQKSDPLVFNVLLSPPEKVKNVTITF